MLEADPSGTLRRYLSEQEIPRFEGLKTSKRRLEWLAGRVVAKRLIREERFAREGAIVPYGAITILPDDLGAPRVQVAGEAPEPLLISISHSAGVAMAFQSLEKRQRPGIDVEQIEPRDASFERDYFSEAELVQVRSASNKDALLTAFWAVKEAYLKGLGIGARVDFRELEVAEEEGRWSVTHRGEAREHALRLCAGEPTIEVEMEQDRVIARVLLPLSEAPETRASV
jgi:phosphopantetheine--protein transferase-like protein